MSKKQKQEDTSVKDEQDTTSTESNEEKETYNPIKKHDAPVASSHADSELKELIEKNIKWSQVIYNQNKKIKRRLTWMAIGSYTRLLLILIPLLLALFYLPPILKEVWSQYGSMLGNSSSTGSMLDLLRNSGVDSDQVQEALKALK